MKSEDMRQQVERLNEAEDRIGAAVKGLGYVTWTWARYGKPSSGGPFMWNDIDVKRPDGTVWHGQAEVFVELLEEQ